MSETFSLSIFTIEADRKPVLAFAAKKTPRGRGVLQRRESANQTHIGQIRRCCRFAMTI
jgi:hypothetical protein